MSILACIPEVGYGKMVFNLMNYGGVYAENPMNRDKKP